MHDELTALIPLLAPDGSVVGHAVVDAANVSWLNQWVWRAFRPFSSGPYKGRYGPYAGRAESHGGKKVNFFMHREVVGLPAGARGPEVDHINRNTLDNRRENLRVVSRAQNLQNKPAYRGSTSGARGVYWNAEHGKWAAQGRLDGHNHHLGYFAGEDDAAAAAVRWRAVHMPYANELVAIPTPD